MSCAVVAVDKEDIFAGRVSQAFISASAEAGIYFLVNVTDTAVAQHRALYDCCTEHESTQTISSRLFETKDSVTRFPTVPDCATVGDAYRDHI